MTRQSENEVRPHPVCPVHVSLTVRFVSSCLRVFVLIRTRAYTGAVSVATTARTTASATFRRAWMLPQAVGFGGPS